MLERDVAKPRDIRSLQNWVNGNGCLSWEETEYLTHCGDLCTVVPSDDRAVVRFETWVENGLIGLLRRFRNVSTFDPIIIVQNPNLTLEHNSTRIPIYHKIHTCSCFLLN